MPLARGAALEGGRVASLRGGREARITREGGRARKSFTLTPPPRGSAAAAERGAAPGPAADRAADDAVKFEHPLLATVRHMCGGPALIEIIVACPGDDKGADGAAAALPVQSGTWPPDGECRVKMQAKIPRNFFLTA